MVSHVWLVHLMSFVIAPFSVWFFGLTSYYGDYFRTVVFNEGRDNNVFDFIVVGSGSGGAVVAKRLSTVPSTRVLVLEAGGDPCWVNNVPGVAIDLFGRPETDWMHTTTPQSHACWGMENNESFWNAGKVLGGSTVLNYMFYLRGHPLDYDNWANLTGDRTWAYENVLPYFKKSIKNYDGRFGHDDKAYSESPYGYLNIEDRSWLDLHEEFIKAGEEFGFSKIDPNCGIQNCTRSGFAMLENTQKNRMRHGTYDSIIKQLEEKPNVKISRFSHVIKIKFDRNMRAEGVWYMHHGIKKFARARKEVILSAGAVNSPVILMHSGIGDKSHLESFGIKHKVQLPVGQNLHDHFMVPVTPFILNDSVSFVVDRDFSPMTIYNFVVNKNGPLTVPSGMHSQIFMSSSLVQKDRDWPDIQGYFAPGSVSSPSARKMIVRATRMRHDLWSDWLTNFENSDSLLILIGNVRPKSRGDVKLKSRDPLDRPLINPNYLKHPDDVKAVVESIKRVVEIFESSEPFKALDSHLPNIPVPGCKSHKLFSDAYWECYIRHYTLTVWHPVGTCRMGRIQDKSSVVDSKLRVLHTKGLRVIDASIMPEIPNANTMAPTMMVAEKGAEFIRQFWAAQFEVSDKIEYYLRLDTMRKCYYSLLI